MGEVELILMGGRVRAVIETELAVVALVDDLMMIGRGQFCDVAFVPVDAVQKRIERGAEIETAAAPVADFIDPERFLVQLLRIDRIDEAETLHGWGTQERSAIGYPRSRFSGSSGLFCSSG